MSLLQTMLDLVAVYFRQAGKAVYSSHLSILITIYSYLLTAYLICNWSFNFVVHKAVNESCGIFLVVIAIYFNKSGIVPIVNF